MDDAQQLARLTEAIARLVAADALEPSAQLSDIDFNSIHLVELMFLSDTIYGFEIPFEELDLTIDISVQELHDKILLLASANT